MNSDVEVGLRHALRTMQQHPISLSSSMMVTLLATSPVLELGVEKEKRRSVTTAAGIKVGE